MDGTTENNKLATDIEDAGKIRTSKRPSKKTVLLEYIEVEKGKVKATQSWTRTSTPKRILAEEKLLQTENKQLEDNDQNSPDGTAEAKGAISIIGRSDSVTTSSPLPMKQRRKTFPPLKIGTQRTLRKKLGALETPSTFNSLQLASSTLREIKNPSGTTPPRPRNCSNIIEKMPLLKGSDANRIIIQGYLVKRGHVRKNWKVRWFTLTCLALTYSTKPETLSTPKGQIVLCNNPEKIYVQQAQGIEYDGQHRPHCFYLLDRGTKKDYLFDACSEKDLRDWMKAISQTIADNVSNLSFRFYMASENKDSTPNKRKGKS